MKFLFLFTQAALLASVIAEPVPLQIGPANDVKMSVSDGVATIVSEGGNPHFWTEPLPEKATLETHPILSFDYFSEKPLPNVRARIPNAEDAEHVSAGTVPPAETWQTFGIDLRLANRPYVSGNGKRMALIFGTSPGTEFQIRNLCLRPPNANEMKRANDRETLHDKREHDAAAYIDYLHREWPAIVKSLTVSEKDIVIRGTLPARDDLVKVAVTELQSHHASWLPATNNWPLYCVTDWKAGDVEFRLPRFDGKRERAASRWKIVGIKADGTRLTLSPALYPTAVDAGMQRPLKEHRRATTIKGLGGATRLNPAHEIFDLGIGHATVNIHVGNMLAKSPRRGFEARDFEGKTFYLNPGYLRRIEDDIRVLTEKKIVVSAILLVSNARDSQGNPRSPMVHPEALPNGILAMPDLATEEGAWLYRAGIDLLTERFTRPDARVSNWIIHNEVDQAGVWTNMGEQPMPRLMETYIRSARLVHHFAQRFDPHARAFISHTHHWMKKNPGGMRYVTKEMIELFAKAARVENDFEWGLAYHPYPEDLRNPETWNDTIDWTFDTPYITPKNVEVLPAYMAQSRFLWQGKIRGLLFSEQGANARSLSPEDQNVQAAAVAYIMQRVRQLPAIEAYHYHGYMDQPEGEGGLLLGLTNRHHGHKKAWEVYAAIDMPNESEVLKFAWPVIGVEGPNELTIKPLPQP